MRSFLFRKKNRGFGAPFLSDKEKREYKKKSANIIIFKNRASNFCHTKKIPPNFLGGIFTFGFINTYRPYLRLRQRLQLLLQPWGRVCRQRQLPL